MTNDLVADLRHYAIKIAAINDPIERRLALLNVPEKQQAKVNALTQLLFKERLAKELLITRLISGICQFDESRKIT